MLPSACTTSKNACEAFFAIGCTTGARRSYPARLRAPCFSTSLRPLSARRAPLALPSRHKPAASPADDAPSTSGRPPAPSSRPRYEGPQDPPQLLTELLVAMRNSRREGVPERAVQLIEDRRRAGAVVHPINYSAAVDCCLRHGDRPRARQLFRALIDAGFHWPPAYCAMLLRCCEGPGEGIALLQGLEQSGRVPDLKVLMALMNLCAEHGDVEGVERLQGRLDRGEYSQSDPENTLAGRGAGAQAALSAQAMASQGRRIVKRRNAFDVRDPLVEGNLLLKAYVRSAEPERVFEGWQRLVEGGAFAPDTVSYNILAEGLSVNGPGTSLAEQMAACERLLDDMVARAAQAQDPTQLPDAVTYTSLLKAIRRVGVAATARSVEAHPTRPCEGTRRAHRLMDRIVREATEGLRLPGLEGAACLDLPLRSALIDALSALGRTDEALTLLNAWVAEGAPPRKYAYTALARAFALQGRAYLVEHAQERAGMEAAGRRGRGGGEYDGEDRTDMSGPSRGRGRNGTGNGRSSRNRNRGDRPGADASTASASAKLELGAPGPGPNNISCSGTGSELEPRAAAAASSNCS